jgi:L-fuconolactonase
MMSSELNRRGFLNQTAQVAAAALPLAYLLDGSKTHAAPPAQQKDQSVDAPIPIIDTHQHLWDLAKFNLPWTKGNSVLGKSFVTSDYLEATKGLNVVKTVYMEVDMHPSQHDQEAEYVIDLCRRDDNPMVAAVISGRPASEGFKDYITKYKDNPYIKGVRQILHVDSTPPGYCLDSQFVRSVQLLGDMGKSFDLCMRPGELFDGDKLVAQCPNTRFVIDHCGNGNVQEQDPAKIKRWQDGMKALAQRPNTVCKISGIVVTAPEKWTAADLQPNMQYSMETFGPDRSMFAGDWPVCTLRATFRQWVEALKQICRNMNMSAGNQKKLFHDNAMRFYGLKETV